MSARGTDPMNKVRSQRAEPTGFVGWLAETGRDAICPDQSSDDAGRTVRAVAAHLAKGYDRLGRFLRAGGYLPHPPSSHDHADHADDDRADPVQDRLPCLRIRLAARTASVRSLAGLADQQLDSGSTRFSDGRRALAQLLDAAHQTRHLAALKRVVG